VEHVGVTSVVDEAAAHVKAQTNLTLRQTQISIVGFKDIDMLEVVFEDHEKFQKNGSNGNKLRIWHFVEGRHHQRLLRETNLVSYVH
jgi:hypothetical protein